MASKETNKTIITVGVVAVLAFVAWRLLGGLGSKSAAGNNRNPYVPQFPGSAGDYYPQQPQQGNGLASGLLSIIGQLIGSLGRKSPSTSSGFGNGAGGSGSSKQSQSDYNAVQNDWSNFWGDVSQGNNDLLDQNGYNSYSGLDQSGYGLDNYQIDTVPLSVIDNLPQQDYFNGPIDNSGGYIDTQSPDLGSAGFIPDGGGYGGTSGDGFGDGG